MQRTVTSTLRVSADDAAKLARVQAAFTAACNVASTVAWDTGTYNQVRLHHAVYYRLREECGLLAQLAVRAVAVVADAYKADKQRQCHFRPDAAIVYDERLYRLEPKGGFQRVSLATLDGRIVCELAIGGYQRTLLSQAVKIGQADVFQDSKGRWRIAFSLTLPDPAPTSPEGGVLGIDLGIKNIAADSDGTLYSGAHVNGLRRRYHRLRKKLQAKGTKSARWRLRSWRGKQQRFQADVNHQISKKIVAVAATTHRAIAVEDLNGIRARARTASGDQRRLLHGWAFAQLRAFITYKAEATGLPVIAVDPRYTSQTCPACGHVARKNRPNQSTFRCAACGFAGHADIIAATNLAVRGRAAINLPHVGVDALHLATHKLLASASSS